MQDSYTRYPIPEDRRIMREDIEHCPVYCLIEKGADRNRLSTLADLADQFVGIFKYEHDRIAVKVDDPLVHETDERHPTLTAGLHRRMF